MAGFFPRWGNAPSLPGQGPVWAKYASFRLPTRRMVSQKPEVVRGVKKEQVKGPGSLEASRAGSLRPAEPSVTGFLPGVNFPVFRGRFGGLGVTDGVRKQEFPGGKPFLRVSPPGSTKG